MCEEYALCQDALDCARGCVCVRTVYAGLHILSGAAALLGMLKYEVDVNTSNTGMDWNIYR